MHRTRFIIAYLNESLGIFISPCCTCTSMIDFFLFQSIIKLPWNIEKKEWHRTKTSNTMVNVFISFSLKICYKYEHRKWVFAVFMISMTKMYFFLILNVINLFCIQMQFSWCRILSFVFFSAVIVPCRNWGKELNLTWIRVGSTQAINIFCCHITNVCLENSSYITH